MSTTITLDTLATEINSEHTQAITTAQTSIGHARRCGVLLLKAKDEVGHGGFLAWLAANCHVGERQARRYMTIATNWRLISISDPESDLTIKAALRLVKPEPGRVNGEDVFSAWATAASARIDANDVTLPELAEIANVAGEFQNSFAEQSIRAGRAAGQLLNEFEPPAGPNDDHGPQVDEQQGQRPPGQIKLTDNERRKLTGSVKSLLQHLYAAERAARRISELIGADRDLVQITDDANRNWMQARNRERSWSSRKNRRAAP